MMQQTHTPLLAMDQDKHTLNILIAEDDEDDYLLTMEALKEAGVTKEVQWVKDGEELMEYLLNTTRNSNAKIAKPLMIILDLNMPRKNGREALEEIKTNPELRHIPVIVLSTSKTEGDIYNTYNLGVNSFIQKPTRFVELVKTFRVLTEYWFDIVKLPS